MNKQNKEGTDLLSRQVSSSIYIRMKIKSMKDIGWKYYTLLLSGVAIIVFLLTVVPKIWIEIPTIIEIFTIGYVCVFTIIIGLKIHIKNKFK